jgi:hypothetical protein
MGGLADPLSEDTVAAHAMSHTNFHSPLLSFLSACRLPLGDIFVSEAHCGIFVSEAHCGIRCLPYCE